MFEARQVGVKSRTFGKFSILKKRNVSIIESYQVDPPLEYCRANELSVKGLRRVTTGGCFGDGDCRGTRAGNGLSPAGYRRLPYDFILRSWHRGDSIMSEYPRITYQSSGRTFDRLFKGTEFPLVARGWFCVDGVCREQRAIFK